MHDSQKPPSQGAGSEPRLLDSINQPADVAALDDAALVQALAEINADLPDYARIARFVRAPLPFSAANGLLTSNGRPRREAILSQYQAAVDECYRRPPAVVVSGAIT